MFCFLTVNLPAGNLKRDERILYFVMNNKLNKLMHNYEKD